MKTRIFIVCFLSFVRSWGQVTPKDSIKSLKLEEVEVVDFTRLKDYSTGSKIEKIDSAQLSRSGTANLADVLAQSNYLFIKSYSPGGLSTPSFRGTSANHTAVLWNGFNLQSPMNGTLDLALVPSEFLDNVAIQFGGKSALYGSGSIGGTIHLNNGAQYNTGVKATAYSRLGSFGNYREGLQLQVSKKKSVTSIKVFEQDLTNDFPFLDSLVRPPRIERQNHAQIKQNGLLLEQYFKMTSKQQLSFRYWYSDNQRQIPPVIGTFDQKAYQRDGFSRITAEWSLYNPVFSWHVRSAFFDETLNYKDLSINSFSHSWSSITEVETNIKLLTNQSVNVDINDTYSKAVSDGYPNYPQLNRTSLFASYKIAHILNAITIVASGRQEVYKGKLVPFTPSFGIEYVASKSISLKGNVSRNYRIPTFNDLYWKPGGNPFLKPESGWGQEVGITYKTPSVVNGLFTLFPIVFNTTVYSNITQNWVIWLPDVSYWRPRNIDKVWARGAEMTVKLKMKLNKVQVEISGNYDNTVSTNEKVEKGSENELHKQLIYVPFNKGSGQLGIGYKDYRLDCNLSYTGFRYTTADNDSLNFLPSYTLFNFQLSRTLRYKNFRIDLFARVNNAFNESYQVIAWRPMPQRNYLAGIAIQFNPLNKNNNP